jgi:PAS domain S-box-containing protein
MSDSPEDIRARALRLLAQSGDDPGPSEAADFRAVLEELRIHQIELEMQNEELKRATESAEGAKRQYADLFQNAPVGYVILDEQGLVLQVNQTFAAQVGGEPEFAGKPFVSFLVEADQPVFLARFRAIFRVPQGKQLELRLRRSGGDPLPVRMEASLHSLARGADHSRLLLAVSDLSAQRRSEAEREKLRAQFLQAQKMEAVGQLAGGVAHDFNNILAAMIMQLDIIRTEPDMPREELAQSVDELLESARRAAALTRQLLLFSRRQAMKMVRADLNVLVTAMTKLLHRLIGETIDLSVEPHPEPLWIECDVGMIEQVLMNLCVNARDAMPRGGPLALSVLAVTGGTARRDGDPAAHFACIRVTDQGSGIDPEHLSHVFEPFFTTKGPGKGTGLGLSSVHGIVTQHGGWVEVDSRQGRGSTFNVYLPVTTPGSQRTPVPAAASALGRGERILVVEDEPAVRRMVVRCLLQVGYQVVEAANGDEAVLIWERERQQFDVLFTDMVMPGALTGLELATQLKERKAGLRTIIASGYSGGITDVIPTDIAFLPKPFDALTLVTAVRQCLDATG